MRAIPIYKRCIDSSTTCPCRIVDINRDCISIGVNTELRNEFTFFDPRIVVRTQIGVAAIALTKLAISKSNAMAIAAVV